MISQGTEKDDRAGNVFATGIVEVVSKEICFVSRGDLENYWMHKDEAKCATRMALEYLRDHVTAGMKIAGGHKAEAMMFEGDDDWSGEICTDMGTVFKAMISQALTELDKEA